MQVEWSWVIIHVVAMETMPIIHLLINTDEFRYLNTLTVEYTFHNSFVYIELLIYHKLSYICPSLPIFNSRQFLARYNILKIIQEG